MSQQDVYNALKKKRKWMTSIELCKLVDVNKHTITVNLNKLLKSGDVLRKERKYYKQEGGYLWKIKR